MAPRGALRFARPALARLPSQPPPSSGALSAPREDTEATSAPDMSAQKRNKHFLDASQPMWIALGLHRQDMRRLFSLWLWGGVVMMVTMYQYTKGTEMVDTLHAYKQELEDVQPSTAERAAREAQKEAWIAEMRERQAAKVQSLRNHA
eukprot:TRINITY_DN21209_c0_g1_i1.p1 TRINITY_DN21209_c0_g1~~TRINITY_DN21209_c0_g1_i1.p1  ORF type:complete len:148 (+),score=34.51 TRINITY_DN21209_c0_g1_i1:54-497(+)